MNDHMMNEKKWNALRTALLTAVAVMLVLSAVMGSAWAYFTTYARAKGGYPIVLGHEEHDDEEFKNWEKTLSITVSKDSRPVYLQRDDRIQAHFLTCFLALYIYRILEKRIGERFTSTELLKTLRDYKLYQIPGVGYLPCYPKTAITDALHDAFGFRTDFQINTNAAMKNNFRLSKT